MPSHARDSRAHRSQPRRFDVVVAMAAFIALLAALAPAPLSATAAVPTPGANQAIISVKVGGTRLPNGTVQGLPGVRLSLYGAGTGISHGGNTASITQGTPGTRYSPTWSWTTCISDADGDCNFIIPIRTGTPSSTGVPQDTRFWVQQAPTDASPTGWYSNPSVRLGTSDDQYEFTWQYRFRTGPLLRAGTTYLSTAAMSLADGLDPDVGFMRNRADSSTEVADLPLVADRMVANISRSTGTWAQSRVNPPAAAQCGIDVAVIVDTSNSINESGGMAPVRAALDQLVDGFRGTPTNMSLFSFSSNSPGSGASNHPNLLPVSTAAQATTFKSQYASWTASGGTSWDMGFRAAANSGNAYDLAILLTDGNPTVEGSTPLAVQTGYNSHRDLDAGIFSANQLKTAGTRIVALGVGGAVNSVASALNLRAVSGTSEGSDYIRVPDYASAAVTLSQLARANCQGSIEVQKMIVPPNGTIASATPAPAGWQFAATSLTGTMAVAAPSTAATTSTSNVVRFGLSFANPTTTGTVRILETQQPGYEIVPIGSGTTARNATCVNTETGAAVAVTNAGTSANPGFTTTAVSRALISCTVYNRLIPTDLAVTKAWVVDGVSYANGAQPSGMSAQLQLTGPELAGASNQEWGVVRPGYDRDEVATITETTTLAGDYTHCEVTAAVTQVNGLATNVALGASGYEMTLSQEHNTVQVRNTVTCEQNLTLVKLVTFGDEPASSWTLAATAPAPALTGPTGTHSETTPVTAPVTAGVYYELIESGGPDTYVQLTWDCVLTEEPTVAVAVDDGFVAVPRGQDVTCTVGNATATITLLKHVIEPMPGFEANAWNLTATPAELLGGTLPTETIAGAEEDVNGASTFEVRPGHEYTLSEAATTATLAYRQVGIERWDGVAWIPLTSAEILAPAPGQNTIYRFVNERIPLVMLPLTGGASTDTHLIGGVAVLVVALGGAVWASWRRRNMT